MRWELQPGPAPPARQIEAIGRAGATRRQGTAARSETKPLR
jgi:hypothetical protein